MCLLSTLLLCPQLPGWLAVTQLVSPCPPGGTPEMPSQKSDFLFALQQRITPLAQAVLVFAWPLPASEILWASTPSLPTSVPMRAADAFWLWGEAV